MKIWKLCRVGHTGRAYTDFAVWSSGGRGAIIQVLRRELNFRAATALGYFASNMDT